MKKLLCLSILLISFFKYSHGQICSANPGGDQAICLGDAMTLYGEFSPLYYNPLNATWTLVNSDPMISLDCNDFDDCHALVTGVSPQGGGFFDNGEYEFELCVLCIDSVFACQNVIVTVNGILNQPTIDPHPSEICGSNVTIVGSVPDNGVTASWFISPQFDGTFSTNDNELTLNHNGGGDCTYELIYTQSIGSCSKTVSTTVSFVKDYSNITARTFGCPSCSYTIRLFGTSLGCGGGAANWEFVSGPTGVTADDVIIHSPTSSNTSVTTPENGHYCFRYTITTQSICPGGTDTVCCDIDYQDFPGLPGSVTYLNCLDEWTIDELFLDNPLYTGATYQWSVVSSSIVDHGITFSDDQSASTTVKFAHAPMQIGPAGWKFRLRLTMNIGPCIDTRDFTFYVNPTVELRAESVGLLCGGDPYYRLGENIGSNIGGLSYTAEVLSSPNLPVGDPVSVFSIDLTVDGTHCFKITGSRTGIDPNTGGSVTCSDEKTFCVVVANVSTIDCGSPIETCLLSVQLNGNIPRDADGHPLNIPVKWETSSSAIINNPNSEDPIITGLDYDNVYVFTYTISERPDCIVQCTNTVTVLPKDSCVQCELDMIVGDCINGCTTVELDGADSYTWTPETGVDNSDPNSPIICVAEDQDYLVFGYKDGELCGSQLVEIKACSITTTPECDFNLSQLCTTCSCGSPFGGGRLYDSEGNIFKPTMYPDVTVEWYKDGVYQNTGGDYYQEHYEEPFVLCARIIFITENGEICDETYCIEVRCGGDCRSSYQFKTCADAPFNEHELCKEFDLFGNCNNGDFDGYVWVVDAADNLIPATNIDWWADGSYDSNPYYLNTAGLGCDEIKVYINDFDGCEDELIFNPDCCSQSAPFISCGKGDEKEWEVNFDLICGAKSYNFSVTCISNGGEPVVYQYFPEDMETGSFQIPFINNCQQAVVRMTTVCESGLESPPSNCLLLDNESGECFDLSHLGDLCDGFFEIGFRSINPDLQAKPADKFVMPNPSNNGAFNLHIGQFVKDEIDPLKVNIYNTAGQLVYFQKVDIQSDAIHIRTNLSAGVYFVILQNSSGELRKTEKLMLID